MEKSLTRPEIHRIVRINYAIRTGAFAYSFLVVGLHGWERGFGAAFWVLLALQFIVYPHVMYLRARFSHDPKNAEMANVQIDSALLGAWIGALHFPLWIAYAAIFSTMLNATIVRGTRGGLFSLSAFCAGGALLIAMLGFRYAPQTSDLVTALCFFGSLVYTCGIGFVVHRQNLRFVGTQREIRAAEERYRLIAENAADLIALVDADGRWLYASPSYQRILAEDDLETGADAFRRVHPDDADRARIAVIRSASTGKPRDLSLRLVDREGRIRQYQARIQPIMHGNGGKKNVVLISQDVTDLRDSEERVLLAAHALEGMTEAIMITAADGTVVTVNRAFCDITGYSREDVLGNQEKTIRNALQPPEYYDEVYAAVLRDGYWSGSTWNRRKNGAVYREWRSVRAVRDPAGAVTHYVMVFSEVGAAPQGRAGEAQQA